MLIKPKKIVLVAYGGGHVNMLVPVIKKLQENHNLELVVLGLTTAGSVLEKQGIAYLGFKDLLKPSDKKALVWGEKLAAPANLNAVVPYEESVAYMGLSYMDLEFRHGVEKAAHIYQAKGGRQAFYPLSVMERFLREEQPDLVVATNSPRAERAAITAAGELGIPAICLVDLFAIQEVQWIGQPGYANKVCVLSDFVQELMIKAGRSRDEVVVTGNPAFDSMAKAMSSSVRSGYRQKRGWQDDERVVLWASGVEPMTHPFTGRKGDPGLPRKVEAQLCKLATEQDKLRVVFRPHPNDNYVPGNLPVNVEVSSAISELNELLMAVDVVVVLASTVGLQAALMCKPLVNIKLSMFAGDAPYDEMGISIGVDKLGELKPAIMKALNEGQAGKGLPETGTATTKFINVIYDLLSVSSPKMV